MPCNIMHPPCTNKPLRIGLLRPYYNPIVFGFTAPSPAMAVYINFLFTSESAGWHVASLSAMHACMCLPRACWGGCSMWPYKHA